MLCPQVRGPRSPIHALCPRSTAKKAVFSLRGRPAFGHAPTHRPRALSPRARGRTPPRDGVQADLESAQIRVARPESDRLTELALGLIPVLAVSREARSRRLGRAPTDSCPHSSAACRSRRSRFTRMARTRAAFAPSAVQARPRARGENSRQRNASQVRPGLGRFGWCACGARLQSRRSAWSTAPR